MARDDVPPWERQAEAPAPGRPAPDPTPEDLPLTASDGFGRDPRSQARTARVRRVVTVVQWLALVVSVGALLLTGARFLVAAGPFRLHGLLDALPPLWPTVLVPLIAASAVLLLLDAVPLRWTGGWVAGSSWSLLVVAVSGMVIFVMVVFSIDELFSSTFIGGDLSAGRALAVTGVLCVTLYLWLGARLALEYVREAARARRGREEQRAGHNTGQD